MRHDILRAGMSLLLMGALAASGLPFWLFLSLPLVAYAGLWLLVAAPEIEAPRDQPVQATGERAAYETCLSRRSHIEALSGHIHESGVTSQLLAVTTWMDKSLDAIVEDEKYAAAIPLSDLIEFTDKLVSAYVKVVRRGFADPDLPVQICDRLRTIERACKRFWDRLNRDAVVDLQALSETIEVLLEVAGRPEDVDALTSLPGAPLEVLEDDGRTAAQSAPVAASPAPGQTTSNQATSYISIPKLTPREREILCLLPTGKTDQEIANEQFISPRTVSKHIEAVYGKLGVRNRAEAVAFAVRHGLCDEEGARAAETDR